MMLRMARHGWEHVPAVLAAYGLALCLTIACARADVLATETVMIETRRGTFAIAAELADSPQTRAQGLQHRRSLASDAGMLFDFKTDGWVAMWMKNTPISLDMVFIDCAGRVLNVVSDTEPFSLTPIRSAAPARAVLELAAGTAERLGIDAGSLIRHRLFPRTGGDCGLSG